jgi:hypothetical protein
VPELQTLMSGIVFGERSAFAAPGARRLAGDLCRSEQPL